MLSDLKLNKFQTISANYAEINVVYLFGSYASGKNRINSDIDMGIVFSDSSLEKQKTDLYADFIRKGIDNADIVYFNSADLVLQFETIHHNKPIYSKESFNHGALFSKTIREYFDFKPYLDRQRQTYKERILNA